MQPMASIFICICLNSNEIHISAFTPAAAEMIRLEDYFHGFCIILVSGEVR